jgi:5-methylcytosine-specific restriction endonuclease McrA
MPTRLCLHRTDGHGCPNPAIRTGRCELHAKERGRETHPNRGFYDKARWRRTARAVLFDQPLCSCGEIAVDVDHIQAIEDGGDPWARSNLRGLCKSCHGKKTRAEMRGR